MIGEHTLEPVRQSVTVPLSPERAFALFVDEIGAWWPHTHSLATAPFQSAFIEPRVGGRWYERAEDGAECEWGRVLAYDPPRRLSLGWHIHADYTVDPDPRHASTVDVRFHPHGEGSTRVELAHHGFERHGAGAAGVHASVGSPGGWPLILDLYRQAAA